MEEGSRQLHIEEFKCESMGPHSQSAHDKNCPDKCLGMIDALVSALASRITPSDLARDASNDEDHYLNCIAHLAKAVLSDVPAFSSALSDLTQHGIAGVACDLSLAFHQKAHARGFANRRDFSSAARALTKNLALIDEAAHASEAGICYTSRAICLLQLGWHASAAEDCAAALKLNRGNAKAHFLRAVALKELQQHSAALQHAQAAVSSPQSCKLPADAIQDAKRLLADCQTLADPSEAIHQSHQPAQRAKIEAEPCNTLPRLEIVEIAQEGRALCMGEQEGTEAGALLMKEDAVVSTTVKKRRKQVTSFLCGRAFWRVLLASSTMAFPSTCRTGLEIGL